jgi:hypothetical protein
MHIPSRDAPLLLAHSNAIRQFAVPMFPLLTIDIHLGLQHMQDINTKPSE